MSLRALSAAELDNLIVNIRKDNVERDSLMHGIEAACVCSYGLQKLDRFKLAARAVLYGKYDVLGNYIDGNPGIGLKELLEPLEQAAVKELEGRPDIWLGNEKTDRGA